MKKTVTGRKTIYYRWAIIINNKILLGTEIPLFKRMNQIAPFKLDADVTRAVTCARIS